VSAKTGVLTNPSACLLDVRLDAVRQAVVYNGSHVGLVEAHAEGDGGGDQAHFVEKEEALGALALLRLLSGVVAQRGDAVGEKELRQAVRLVLARRRGVS
jgi:hypothetical protein